MKSLHTRRSALGASLALSASLWIPGSGFATPRSAKPARKPRRPRPQITEARLRALGLYFTTAAYTASTAPHKLTRDVLSRATPGLKPASFVNQIEQNFARMDPARAARFMATLQDRELAALAQSYANACAVRFTHTPRLQDILALQLTPAQLGRVSQHFGFAPLYDSVIRLAPHKSLEFQRHTNPNFMAPVPRFDDSYGPNSGHNTNSNLPPLGPLAPYVAWLDSTPRDIYLTFRTSPNIGLLSVTSSLAATLGAYSFAAHLAWGFGYGVGTLIAQFVQWASPSLWDDIGGTVNQILENWNIDISSTTNTDTQVAYTGEAQYQLASAFAVPIAEQAFLQETGGDYGVFAPWSYETFDYPDANWETVAAQYGTVGFPPLCDYCEMP